MQGKLTSFSCARWSEKCETNIWRCKTKFTEQLIPKWICVGQDVDTRFGTTFLVVQRFLNSATEAWTIMMNQQRDIAFSPYSSLESSSHDSVLRFPALEAVVYAFEELYQTTAGLEVPEYSSIHLELPSLFNCIQTLVSIANGERTRHGQTACYIYPSRYSKQLARLLSTYLKEKVEIHDLWIFGCYLHPFRRQMDFVSHIPMRNEYRARAEAIARALSVAIDRQHDISKPSDIDSECSDELFNATSSSCREPVAKKRKLNLAEFADSRKTNIPTSMKSLYTMYQRLINATLTRLSLWITGLQSWSFGSPIIKRFQPYNRLFWEFLQLRCLLVPVSVCFPSLTNLRRRKGIIFLNSRYKI